MSIGASLLLALLVTGSGCHIFDRHNPPGHMAHGDPAQEADGAEGSATSAWIDNASLTSGTAGRTFSTREAGKLHVWLHHGCEVNAPTPEGYQLTGDLGFRVGTQTTEPVPVTVTADGVTLTGLPRGTPDAFVINKHDAEDNRPSDLDGYAYLFDIDAQMNDSITILGHLGGSGQTRCRPSDAWVEFWMD